jgi:hypothetical protein
VTAPAEVDQSIVDAPVPQDGPPTGWRGLLLPLNTESGDGRIFELADGAEPDVRPLPLPLCAQAEIGDGHDGGVVVGLIERVWVKNGAIHGEGTFDLADPVAADWARKLGDGYAGWVSADMDRIRYTQVPFDDAGVEIPAEQIAEIEAPADVKYVVSQHRLMGATMVSGPAFAEAKIEPVWGTEPSDHELVAAANEQVDDGNNKKVPEVASDDEAEPEHKGGMVALIPAADDAKRLAVDGGEPAEELHTTLAYLGDDVRGWTPEQQAATIEAVQQVRPAPVEGKVFAHARFNPGPDGPDECAVYLTEAQGLNDLRSRVVAALKGHPDVPVDDETDTYDNYIPHVTAGYGLDVSTLSDVGPIRYDRLRIALAGVHHDIPLEPVTAALVAAAIVYPLADFADPHLDQPTAITVTADGHVFGHVADWQTCHIGLPGCTTAPSSASNYRYFHQGIVDTDAGPLPVGKLTLGTGHAGLNKSAAAAAAHYDNTGSAVAIVRCGEDAHGIWMAGRILPGTSDEDIAALRRSGISGDWRGINGTLEMIAALAVNVPGFPIPRTETLAASANLTLVAAGVVANRPPKRKAPKGVDPAELDAVFAAAGQQAQEAFVRTSIAAARVNKVRAQVAAGRVQQYHERRRDRRLWSAAAAVARVRVDAAARRVARAAEGVDAPGGRMPPQLKRYWLSGPGLARWATTPTPYRSLVKALTEEIHDMTPEQINGLAANLYFAHFGKHPGQHGKDDN